MNTENEILILVSKIDKTVDLHNDMAKKHTDLLSEFNSIPACLAGHSSTKQIISDIGIVHEYTEELKSVLRRWKKQLREYEK